MTTYNTYQEAKIAMPLACIIHDTDDDIFFGMPSREGTTLNDDGCKFAEPHDYCMTVDKFLADGRKFVNGDWFINYGGLVVNVGRGALSVAVANAKQRGDSRSYILRAAALEEKKPRTKVEYEPCHFADAWEPVKAYCNGDELFDGDKNKVACPEVALNLWIHGDLYRRIEIPVTWKEELYDYLDSSCEMSDDFDDSFTIEIEGRPLEFNLNDDEFVDMCKLVASLNSVN